MQQLNEIIKHTSLYLFTYIYFSILVIVTNIFHITGNSNNKMKYSYIMVSHAV